jgi:hypothetical protein
VTAWAGLTAYVTNVYKYTKGCHRRVLLKKYNWKLEQVILTQMLYSGFRVARSLVFGVAIVVCPFDACDCLIEVTAWAGLTAYMTNVYKYTKGCHRRV